ncbi:MAG: HEPN domain-containing protein [Candidatus Bathyarchaeia archaeon]
MERFEEARRWLLQAFRDHKAAKDSVEAGNYEWASFQAQQSAEKAVKALLYGLGIGAWGHSLVELLELLRDQGADEVTVYARELDRHYIPSRYPNSYESGYPGMYYDKETAERAVNYCGAIIDWVKTRLERLGLKL